MHGRTHESHRARGAHHFRLRHDEIAKMHCADELDVELNGGMPLVAGRAPSGQRHDLIGERHQHAAVHVAGAVEVLAFHHEGEAKVRAFLPHPERADHGGKFGRFLYGPAVGGRIEGGLCGRGGNFIVHAETSVSPSPTVPCAPSG
jgi:hypothetical protein